MRPPHTNPQTDPTRRPLPRHQYDSLVQLLPLAAHMRIALWIYARTWSAGIAEYRVTDTVLRRILRCRPATYVSFRRAAAAAGIISTSPGPHGTTYRVLRCPAEALRLLRRAPAEAATLGGTGSDSEPRPEATAVAAPVAVVVAGSVAAPVAQPIDTRAVLAGIPDPETMTGVNHHHHVPDGGAANQPTGKTDRTPLPEPQKPTISPELLDRLRRIRWHGDPSSLTPDQLRRLPEHLADAERDGREPARLLAFRLRYDLGPAADVGPGESLPPRIPRPRAVSLELGVGRPRTTPMLAPRPDCEINIDAEEAYDADAQRRVEGMPAASRDALLAEVREIARRRYQADPGGWDWTGPMAGATFAAAREILVERGEIPSLRAWCAQHTLTSRAVHPKQTDAA